MYDETHRMIGRGSSSDHRVVHGDRAACASPFARAWPLLLMASFACQVPQVDEPPPEVGDDGDEPAIVESPVDTDASAPDDAEDTSDGDSGLVVDTARTPIDVVPPPLVVTPQDVGSPTELPGCAAVPDPALLAPCGPGVGAWSGQMTWPSIRDALGAVGVGDRIVVCPGIHGGPLIISNGVELVAADPTGGTILEGGGTGRIVEQQRGLLTMSGFVFRHGWSVSTGGAVDSHGGTLEIACSLFEGNRSEEMGGAVYAQGPLTIRSSVFLDNEADSGGAVGAGASLEVYDSLFLSNRANRGGGISAGPAARLVRLTMRDNQASYGGGGVEGGGLRDNTIEVEDSWFISNVAGSAGGAICVDGTAASTASIARTLFQQNSSEDGCAIKHDSGESFSIHMIDSNFNHNTCSAGVTIAIGGDQEHRSFVSLDRAVITDATPGPAPSAFATEWARFFGPPAPVDVVARDLVVRRNIGQAPAFLLLDADSMTCERCDFGSGADDNAPADVGKGAIVHVQAPADFAL